MGITRRQFLQVTGATAAGAVAFAGCSPRAGELLVESAARLPEDMVTGIDNWYATICRMCPAGCGIIVRVMEGRAKKIEGNPDYPVNRGKLCARGQAGLQALYHPDRIQGPLRRVGDRGSGRFEPVTWEAALDEMASRLGDLKAGGRAAEALLITEPLRGHLGHLVFRFIQAYGAQWASHEPLEDTFLLRTALSRAFPMYTSFGGPLPAFDLANARFILSFGADLLSNWLSPVQYGVAYGRFRDRPGDRGVLVQVEPRITATGASADLWVPVKPGTEGALALGLAQVMISERLVSREAAAAAGFDAESPVLAQHRPQSVTQTTGVPEDQIVALARRFATQRPSLAIGGGPAAAHTNSSSSLTAIYALNRLVENLGKPGGLVPNPGSPLLAIPGVALGAPLSYWQKLAEAVRSGQPTATTLPPGFPGATPRITPPNVLLIRGANPAYSLPPSLGFREAMDRVPFIARFSSFMDETAAMADLVLPEPTYLEDWGSDVPEPEPGFEVLGFQQPVVNPLFDTRSFGDVLLALGQSLGFERDLPWKSFRGLLKEWASQLVQLRKIALPAGGLEELWIRLLQQGGWWDEQARSMTVVPPVPGTVPGFSEPQFAGLEQDYPFYLQPFPSASLGAGEGAHVPWLQATPDPITTAVWQTWVEVNLETGRRMGLQEGDIVKVESPQGSLEAPVYLHPGLHPDVIAIPMGQGHTLYGRYARDRGANVFELLDPMLQKPDGGLAWAATRVRIIKTGKSGRVSKSEGQVMAVEPSDVEIVGVVRQ